MRLALTAVGLIAEAAHAGWTPTFFVQGQGGTPVRQIVLGSAIAMFVLTAVLLWVENRPSLSPFAYWYALALLLIAAGLFGVMIEPSAGSVLSWTGRAGQFLGGVYMLVAAIASVRESRVWAIPLEEALQRERTFVSAVLETVGALVTVLDREGRIVSFNRACEQTTGYLFEEVRGKCVWDFLLIPEEVEPVKAVFARLRAGQFPNENENYWVAKDGTRRLIHWTNSCLIDSWGAVEYVIGTGVEVTEQRRAQQEREKAAEALRESEERYRTLFEMMTEGFALHEIITDHQGQPCDYRFLDVNPAFERLTGLKRADVIGKRVREVLSSTESHWIENFGNVAITGEPLHMENYSTALKRWYEVFAYCPASGRFAVVFTDITARKQAEDALRASEALYRGIGESIDYGVWVCAGWRNTYASESFLKMVGITQEQCSSFGWGNVLHPDDAARTIAAWQECVRTGGKWDIEHRFRGTDGQWHHVLRAACR